MSSASSPAASSAIPSNPARVIAPRVPLPTDKELVLKVVPMPADCNANGDIFGGWVMAQVDIAGSIVPARYVRGRMATVRAYEHLQIKPPPAGGQNKLF